MALVTSKDMKDFLESAIKSILKKYPDPRPDPFGNLIIPVGVDGKEKIDGSFNWEAKTYNEELAEGRIKGAETYAAQYQQQPVISDLEIKLSIDEKVRRRFEKAKKLAENKERIKRQAEERKEMALVSSMLSEFDQGPMIVKQYIPTEIQDVVLNFFTRDPMNMDKEFILMKSRRAGMNYLQEIVMTTRELERLSKELKEHIDRCCFSQGYVMEDDALLPSDQIDFPSVIESLCESLVMDSDVLNISITPPLRTYAIRGDTDLSVEEERLVINSYSIVLSDHLYQVGRLANQLRCNRKVIIERFKQILLRDWRKKSVDELQERLESVKAFSQAMRSAGSSAREASQALKAMGGIGLGSGIGKAEKSSAIASDKAQRRRSKKKPEPIITDKSRAIDI